MAGRNLLSDEQPKKGGRNLLAAPAQPEIDPNILAQSPAFQRQRAATELARQVGPAKSAAISAGRGLTTIGRAVGLAEPESPAVTRAFEELQRQRPVTTTVGEIVGEAAPFLIPATGIGAIPTLGGRVLGATALGVTEGGAIAKGKGGGFEETIEAAGVGGIVGGTLEAALPIIGRIGGEVVRRVTGKPSRGALIDRQGRPTPELQQALDATGQSFEDLSERARTLLAQQKAGATPEEAARLARFEELGAPATLGDISQEFQQQATEARIVESAADPLGDPLRNIRLQQSRAFENQLNQQIEKAGIPDDVGDSIKAALSGRKKLLRDQKNELYKQVADASPEVRNAPILTDSIIEALPDADTLEDISIVGADVKAINNALVRFGINKDPQAVEAYLDAGGTITPLNIGNFDRFRKLLGGIERADTTGSASVAIGPIRRALDEEAGLIDDALTSQGITDESILAPLREARETVRTLKTEFSPQAVTGRLIDVKRDGVTPVIESSKVFRELMGPGRPPELLDRTLESLRNAGPKGRKAIGDLQAATILDLIGEATKAQTRKVAGERVLGGVPFRNKLDQIGERRLNELFKYNPQALKAIQQVGKALDDITIPAGATPKGSASVILDTLRNAGIMGITSKLPGAGPVVVNLITTALENAGNRTALQRALNARPKVKELAGFVEKELPGLAAPLGIAGLSFETEQQ